MRLILAQFDPGRIERWVISTDLGDAAAVAWRAAIGDHDAEKRFFAAAVAAQPDHKCHKRSILLGPILAPQTQPAHHALATSARDLFHHLAGLLELFDEAVDLL